MKHRFWIILALIAAILCALYFWPRHTARPEDMKIVCTTYPVWLFTRTLTAGTGAPEPILLVPAGTGCPHDYALTTGDMLKLRGAKRLLLVRNGAGLDDAIYAAALKAEPALDSSAAADGFAPAKAPENHTDEPEEAHAEGEHHHHHAGGEAHLFTAPRSTKHMVTRIAGALKEFDPARAEKYAVNERKLLAELDALEQETKKLAVSCRGVKVLAMHGTFDLLLRDLGFELEGIVSEEHNPGLNPAELAALIDRIKTEKIALLVTEAQVPAQIPEKLRRETGIRVVELDSAASGPEKPGPDHYIQVMSNNLRLLRDALPSGK